MVPNYFGLQVQPIKRLKSETQTTVKQQSLKQSEFRFGTHVGSINLLKAAEYAKQSGANIIQVFSTMSSTFEELTKLKQYLEQNDMKVVVHSSYTHNLARKWDQYSFWLKNLEIEIRHAYHIGAIGIVLHFGKRLDLDIEQALNNMYTSLIYMHSQTKEFSVPIFLETSTGQGTEICYKIEELARFYKKISNNPNQEIRDRIKICIDSCHIFAAGYDIRTKVSVKQYLETFDELIGIKYVALIHLNDSKMDLGTRVDRHASIGKGFIGFVGLKHFFNYFRTLMVPIILETPYTFHAKEIKTLSSNIES